MSGKKVITGAQVMSTWDSHLDESLIYGRKKKFKERRVVRC